MELAAASGQASTGCLMRLEPTAEPGAALAAERSAACADPEAPWTASEATAPAAYACPEPSLDARAASVWAVGHAVPAASASAGPEPSLAASWDPEP